MVSSSAQPGPATCESSSRSLAPLCEVGVAYALVEGALWSLGAARYWWSAAAIVWIAGVTIYRKPALRDLGLSSRSFGKSLWIAAAALIFAFVCIGFGGWAGTLHDYSANGALAARGAGYLIWSFEQEFILQSFIFVRLEAMVGSSRAVILAALLFALAHLPSPVLTAGSLLMALLFCAGFRRYRNLYPLAVAHWLIGLSLSLALPDAIARHMRVGIGYLRFITH